MTRVQAALRARVALLAFLGLCLASSALWAQSAAEPASAANAATALSTYRLGPGDIINIRVLGEDDFSKEKIRLSDAGTIFFPSVGEIRLSGLTLAELERQIDQGLRGRVLVNPRVSVEVVEYRPFFVSGMVNRPGSYPYQPGLTVRRAATLAGGLNERASLRRLFVIRENDPTQTPQRVELDSLIGPGDMLTVGESFF